MLARVALVATVATGCTRYATHEVYGPRQETGRALLGAPMVQEEMLASLDAGYEGVRTHDGYGTTYEAGTFSADAGAVRRTHCVQQAEIDYVQQVDVVPHVENRAIDIAGSVILGLSGLAT